MGYSLTLEDKATLREYFPHLHHDLKRQCVWGTLIIASAYDTDTGLFTPRASPNQRGYIKDDYEIRIKLDQLDVFGFPEVYEESGRLLRASKMSDQSPAEWHINKDGSICLGIFPEYEWKNVTAYILDKIIPFFYWASYRESYGIEPWKAYSHGCAGLEEALRMPHNKINGTARNMPCPCFSGKKYKRCCLHRDEAILAAMRKLYKESPSANT